ncbi:2Fe-2S iron-sulfur cluster-binding protein [Shewanella halotolerans]|uniref:2Fe-2S iron-sulfur cluster-binding protein n=1 Tax=Shewanella halotolerans TaxID=2864204 RepID=UPI001C661E7D|nr:2Fe-2S iron-sulfur cluster-binding protein [Shewanella halotolerans]QYJ89640.1 2Fe-2S iron-sulfur cluster binding domain-containing protein [Shewanella halotolerans]
MRLSMISARSLHRILGLIVGAQLLIWTLTGLAFNLIDDQLLDANTMRAKPGNQEQNNVRLIQPTVTLAEIMAEITSQLTNKNAEQLSLKRVEFAALLERPVYRLKTSGGTLAFWGDTGEAVNLNNEQLVRLARQSYIGEARLSSPIVDKEAAQRYGGNPAFYRFDTQDELGTQIFIDGQSGQVKAHENQGSRFKQLLFMLHFIDYFPNNGVNFNHLATQLIASAALLLGLSGAWVLVRKLAAGDYFSWQVNRSADKGERQLTLLSPDGEPLESLTLAPGNLLDNLNNDRIRIPSQCGGGGQCGMCRVRFLEQAPQATVEEQARLKQEHLAQGIRLSCQHNCHQGKIALTSRAQLRFWQKAQSDAEQAVSPAKAS